MSDVLTALIDAETGQRGFLITSDHRYLAPYHQAYATIDRKITKLVTSIGDNPEHAGRIDQIRTLAMQKLEELATVVTTNIQDGTEAARAMVMQHNGRDTMDRIRALLAEMEGAEEGLLNEREAGYQTAKRTTQSAFLVLIATTIGLIIVLVALARREIATRTGAALEHERHAEELNASLTTIETERNEIARLTDIGNFLQSCNSLAEVGRLAGPFLQTLFPASGGALWVYAASRNQLVRFAEWGEPDPRPYFAPDDCWSLRRGQPHHHAPDGPSPACDHTGDHGGETLCLPMVAHGETLGLLTLRAKTPGADLDGRGQRRLADMVVRQLGLTLANLRLRESLNEQSIRDPLTGAFNRRYLEVVAAKEIAQARRYGRPLAVVMLDVDHFKRFNDLHGHSAGDTALVAVCDHLQNNVREGDWVFRYGGEEFVLILHDAAPEAAEAKAAELREGVAALALKAGGEVLPSVTVSMGIAVLPDHGEELEQLLERADEALYAAKQAGRNRVIFAEQAAA